jgi:hypothetical protein
VVQKFGSHLSIIKIYFRRKMMNTVKFFKKISLILKTSDLSNIILRKKSSELEHFQNQINWIYLGTVTDRWHKSLSLESSSDSGINTLWFSPWDANSHLSIRLMSDKLLVSLANNLLCVYRNGHLWSFQSRI